MSNRSKRAHPPASGDTPGKPPNKIQDLARVHQRPSDVQWNDAEIRALIEYVALYHTPNEDGSNVWPAHKQQDFWRRNACRDKVRRFLREKFESLGDAEDAYDINYFDDDVFPSQQDVISSTPQHNDPGASRQAESPMLAFSPLRNAEDRTLPGSILDVVSAGFMKLTQRQRKQLIVHLFHKWLLADVHPELNSNYVPRDFLHLLTSALRVLHVNGKNNVLYDASRCFGEIRPGETVHACHLQGCLSDNTANLEAPPDYKSWYQSMYTLFGNKWAALHNGPMWSYIDDVEEVQPSVSADSIVCNNSQTDPTGCLNASSASTTTDIVVEAFQQTFGSDCELLQTATSTPVQSSPATYLENNSEPNTIAIEDLPVSPEESGVSTEPSPLSSSIAPTSHLWASMSESEIREREGATVTLTELEEMHGIRPSRVGNTSNRDRNPLNLSALKHLHGIHPSARWWLKADGTDIQVGLRESMRNEWSGDIDWGDGELQKRHDDYIKYLEFVRGIGVKQRRSYASIKDDLQKQHEKMVEEKRVS
ncbi:hypothetical protein OS493_029916 [Desmophyllum pertusum]|uniref:Uncharacterized protein n=1 Tax=Desmophyllum pertusum TaxID=174260 RepID=A0A9W9Y8T6_9CNID|nr:hypothetical protein OS493_029916 [Desmophyllum pertusum]